MPGVGLTMLEREEIRVGLDRDEKFAEIARRVKRPTSTVSREVGLNGGREGYRAAAAHERAAKARRRPRPCKLHADPEMGAFVEKELRAGVAPAPISAKLRKNGGATVCAETIYQAAYSKGNRGLPAGIHGCLPSKRRRRKKRNRGEEPVSKGPLGDFNLIFGRAAEADDRSEEGHWEGDLVMGAANRSALVTLVDRKLRYTLLASLPLGHTADETLAAVVCAMFDLPDELRRSLTWDQGREMARHVELASALAMPVYFCEPHSPWQRPTNESTNRLLRRWYPKGTNIFAGPKVEVVQHTLNTTPRRLFGWDTPDDRLKAFLATLK